MFEILGSCLLLGKKGKCFETKIYIADHFYIQLAVGHNHLQSCTRHHIRVSQGMYAFTGVPLCDLAL